MSSKIEEFTKKYLTKNAPNIRSGDVVRVHQKIQEKKGERIQVFEGVVLARKHGTGISSTITVRRIVAGVGVEKIFPLHSPNIAKIEVVKRSKIRRAKLYFLREASGRKARLKRKEFEGFTFEEQPKEVIEETPETEEVTEDSTEETVEEVKEEVPEKKEESTEEVKEEEPVVEEKKEETETEEKPEVKKEN
jgi:large subunit ribosomal protein L19